MPGGLPLKVNRTPRTYLFRVRARRLCGFLRRKGLFCRSGKRTPQENLNFCKNPLTNRPLFGYNTMVIADVCNYARRMEGSRNTGR